MTSPRHREAAKAFMNRIVALDWAHNGEAETVLASLLAQAEQEALERAAKEAEQYGNGHSISKAIRALKDTPSE